MATEVDISVDQGTTFTQTWTVRDEGDNIVNLAAFTGLAMVRSSYDSAVVIFTANTQDSANTMSIDAANGNVRVYFVDNTFSSYNFVNGQNLGSASLVYEVKLTDNDNQSFEVAFGTLTLNRAIVR
jgi:hypothetical protein